MLNNRQFRALTKISESSRTSIIVRFINIKHYTHQGFIYDLMNVLKSRQTPFESRFKLHSTPIFMNIYQKWERIEKNMRKNIYSINNININNFPLMFVLISTLHSIGVAFRDFMLPYKNTFLIFLTFSL